MALKTAKRGSANNFDRKGFERAIQTGEEDEARNLIESAFPESDSRNALEQAIEDGDLDEARRLMDEIYSDDEDEEESGDIDWEAYEDENNPVDDYYKKRFSNAERLASGVPDASGDIGDLEDAGDVVPQGLSGKKLTRFNRLRNAYKRGGPTAGIIGMLVGTFGLSSIVLGPASLLVNLSDLMSNHSDFANRLFVKSGRSYVSAFLLGQTRDCTGKIKCKFATISEKRMNDWKARGIEVEADRTVTGRYKVRALTYKNTRVTSIFDYKALKYTHPEFNSLLKRLPIKASYLNAKSSLKDSLKKFKLDGKGLFRSSKSDNKEERRTENGKAMDSHTGAQVNADGNTDPAKVKTSLQSEIDKSTSGAKSRLGSFRSATVAASSVAFPVTAACMAYDVVRATQAAITLYWHAQLLAFAMPFLEAGAEARIQGASGSSFDWETAEYFGDRVMQPVTLEEANADPNDNLTPDMVGKTAMDAKGVSAALNGDSAVDQNYAGWGPTILGIGLVRDLQETVGKENIRTACNVAMVASYFGLVQCANPVGFIKCLAFAGGQILIAQIWGDDIIAYITDQLAEPAMEAIAKANLTDNLHGPPLGEAITSASGVLASNMDRSSGFAVAGNDGEAYSAYLKQYLDEDYQQEKIADAKYEASKNQFDLNNPYSFASQVAAGIAPKQLDGSLFSVMSNAASIVASIPLVSVASAAKDGVHMPIEIYDTQEQFQDSLDACKNPALNDAGIPCSGESGRAVPQFLPIVEECMDAEADGANRVCINEAIDYLSETAKYENDDGEEVSYIDGETGEPSDFGDYSASTNEYKNPFLMYMRHCGNDRSYPLGYTDTSIQEANDDWYTGIRCATKDVGEEGATKWNLDLAWMSYYYNMCIALYASEEDVEYCWKDTPQNDTQVCGISNSPMLGDFAQGTNAGRTPRMIIVHTTEGDTVDAMANALRANGTSYHVAIDQSGAASRLVPDENISHGAKSANAEGLNIALVGFADKGNVLDASSAQLQTLSKCIGEWSKTYNIPAEKVEGKGILDGGDTRGVAGHIDVARAAGYNDRTDPGLKFPWSEVLANAK